MIFEIKQPETPDPYNTYFVFANSDEAWKCFDSMVLAFPNQYFHICCFGGYENTIAMAKRFSHIHPSIQSIY